MFVLLAGMLSYAIFLLELEPLEVLIPQTTDEDTEDYCENNEYDTE